MGRKRRKRERHKEEEEEEEGQRESECRNRTSQWSEERKKGRREQKKVRRPCSQPEHEVVLGKAQSGSSVTTEREEE